MPLRAKINGIDKISFLYSDEEWDSLNKEHKNKNIQIELPCCHQNGILKISPKGLKYFVHPKSEKNCDWKLESPEHLKAKVEIVNACINNGWKAIPDYSENDCRVDVLAEKDGKRIAFEIQWSYQTAENIKLIQKRYKSSGIRVCWFLRKIPKDLEVTKEIPFFKLFKNENDIISINFNEYEVPISNFVNILLAKKIRYCNSYYTKPIQNIQIKIYETSCWECSKIQHLYAVDRSLISCCESNLILSSGLWSNQGIDKHPSIVKAVNEIILTEKSKNYKIGILKNRNSKTVGENYLSFGCFYCDAIFGDYFLRGEKLNILNTELGDVFNKEVNIGKLGDEGSHWCFSPTKEFCE